jgi:cytidylate kinase
LVRDIHWNPQRHLPADAEDWQDMVEARQRVTVQSDTTWRKERFKELRRLTARIRSRVAGLEDVARSAAERVSAEAAANAVLNRRDYAFCLFPEAELRPFLTRFQEPESSEPNA